MDRDRYLEEKYLLDLEEFRDEDLVQEEEYYFELEENDAEIDLTTLEEYEEILNHNILDQKSKSLINTNQREIPFNKGLEMPLSEQTKMEVHKIEYMIAQFEKLATEGYETLLMKDKQYVNCIVCKGSGIYKEIGDYALCQRTKISRCKVCRGTGKDWL